MNRHQPLRFHRSRGFRGCALAMILAVALPMAIRAAQVTPAATPTTPFIMRVGLNRESFRRANINDATAAYRVFLETIAREKGYDLRVETEILENQDDVRSALQRTDHPLHLLTIGMWDYLALTIPPHIEPRFVVAEHTTPGRRYALLARRDGPLQSLADLRGQPLLKLSLAQNRIADAWLDVTLAEHQLGPADQFFGPVTLSAKATTTILPVFFGTAPVCLVDEPSLELMAELNPQVAATLRIVDHSEVLGDVVICVNTLDWPSPTQRADTIAAVAGLDANPAGRQILTLFKISRLLPFDSSHCDTLRALRARWLALHQPPRP